MDLYYLDDRHRMFRCYNRLRSIWPAHSVPGYRPGDGGRNAIEMFWQTWADTPPRYYTFGEVAHGKKVFGLAMTASPLAFKHSNILVGSINDATKTLDVWRMLVVPEAHLDEVCDGITLDDIHMLDERSSSKRYRPYQVYFRRDADLVRAKMIVS